MSMMRLRIIVVIALVVVSGSGIADEVPKFKPGKWEYSKTLVINNGKELHQKVSRCEDPTSEMREFMQAGSMMGCKWDKPLRSGNQYTSLSACNNGNTKKIIRIIKSDSAYDEMSEDAGKKIHMKQTIIARRIGDCKK